MSILRAIFHHRHTGRGRQATSAGGNVACWWCGKTQAGTGPRDERASRVSH